jgi:single-stranded-DNA-specific exonuclease
LEQNVSMDKQWTSLTGKNAKTIDEAIELLESSRGLVSKESKDEFYNPTHPKEFTPKELGVKSLQVKKLKTLIAKLIKTGEKVIVYGDYDVDGVCSTAIMWEYLNNEGVNVHPFIPDRFTDGYGLNEGSLERIIKDNPDLKTMFLVDNGIVAHTSIKQAKKKGIKVVVIDHHQSDGVESAADITVHSTKVCAAALCYLTTIWLGAPNEALSDSQLPLALLATVADQMELFGVNRSIVFHGLKKVTATNRPGLISLAKKSSIDLSDLDVYKIGFQLAPKINAAGRMDKGMDALRLLCTRDKSRADSLSDHLIELNTKRQKEVEKSLEALKTDIDPSLPMILAHGQFHEGVIGLLAGKLSEEYLKPALVLSHSEGVYKGSARSRNGFDITSYLRKSDIFISIGGHEMASGFSLLEENLNELRVHISRADYTVSQRVLTYDIQVAPEIITLQLAQKVNLLSPFGPGNQEPLLLSRYLKVKEISPLGSDGKHLKVKLSDSDGTEIDFVNFNFRYKYEVGESVDVLFSISLNKWRHKTYLQCIIRDVRHSSDQ